MIIIIIKNKFFVSHYLSEPEDSYISLVAEKNIKNVSLSTDFFQEIIVALKAIFFLISLI